MLPNHIRIYIYINIIFMKTLQYKLLWESLFFYINVGYGVYPKSRLD